MYGLERTRELVELLPPTSNDSLHEAIAQSNAARAAVRLRYSAECVVLEVEDGGVGFDSATRTRGMGLVSMRERAGLVHGRLELLHPDGGGLLVRLTVPLTLTETHA